MRIEYSRWFLFLLILLTIISCSRKMPSQDIQIRKGIVYIKGHEEPYTGYVIGKSDEGYRNKICSFKKQYKKGLLHGRSLFYYENGKLESIEPYKEGKLHGVVTRYYETGQKKARIHFVYGKRGGMRGEIFWDENGKIRN